MMIKFVLKDKKPKVKRVDVENRNKYGGVSSEQLRAGGSYGFNANSSSSSGYSGQGSSSKYGGFGSDSAGQGRFSDNPSPAPATEKVEKTVKVQQVQPQTKPPAPKPVEANLLDFGTDDWDNFHGAAAPAPAQNVNGFPAAQTSPSFASFPSSQPVQSVQTSSFASFPPSQSTQSASFANFPAPSNQTFATFPAPSNQSFANFPVSQPAATVPTQSFASVGLLPSPQKAQGFPSNGFAAFQPAPAQTVADDDFSDFQAAPSAPAVNTGVDLLGSPPKQNDISPLSSGPGLNGFSSIKPNYNYSSSKPADSKDPFDKLVALDALSLTSGTKKDKVGGPSLNEMGHGFAVRPK